MNDLLLQLLEKWIDRCYPPDLISLEHPDGSPVIQFQWFFKGDTREFAYTKVRWDMVYERFNDYWVNELSRRPKGKT